MKKKRIFYIVGAFLLLGACVAAFGEDDVSVDEPVGASDDKPAISSGKEEKKEEIAEIGDEVEAGNLTYKILSVESRKSIKNSLGETYTPGAGQYLVLEVEVKNTGKEKITMDSALTKLIDAEGAEYEADRQVDPWINGQGGQSLGFFLEPINPNAKKSGKIAFDVPEKPKKNFTFVAQGGFLSGDEAKIKLK